MTKRKKRRGRQGVKMKRGVSPLRVLLGLVVAGGLIGGGVYVGHNIAASVKKERQTEVTEATSETETETETQSPFEYNFEYKSMSLEECQKGSLILVNNYTEYRGQGTEDLVSVVEERNLYGEDGSGNTSQESDGIVDGYSFSVTTDALMLDKSAADALIKMLDSFRREKGIDNILLCSGYRSTEQQQGLYDEDLAETGLDYSLRVALPGYSEHETGYALDLDIVEGEYDGTGDYAYIDRICKSFGYILRYTADKTNITKIEYEPWHYRYVGVPHASYITDNRLVLEEYIATLEELYNFSNGDLLETTAPDGVVYGIYYYDMENLGFNVPVPSDKEYSISGTNTGGVVITFDTGKRGDYKAAMDENLKNLSENYLSKVMPTETQTDTEEDTTLWSWEDEGGIDYEGNDDGSYDGGDNSGGDGNGDGSDSGDDFVPEIADVGSEKSFGSVTTPPPKETDKKKYVPVEYDV